jgi:hypothetical protein
MKRPMTISGDVIGEVKNFKCLGSFVQMNVGGKRGKGRPKKR